MMKPIAAIIGLCVLGLLGASVRFQNSDEGVRHYLKNVEGSIGKPFSMVEREHGVPDEKDQTGNVFTYFITKKSDNGEAIVVGYRQFGHWGGGVGCFGERNVMDEMPALSLYQRVLEYMSEDDRTVGKASHREDSFGFTENHRMSRRLDTMWEVDALFDGSNSTIKLFVYNHENRACLMELLAESNRLEKKLGL